MSGHFKPTPLHPATQRLVFRTSGAFSDALPVTKRLWNRSSATEDTPMPSRNPTNVVNLVDPTKNPPGSAAPSSRGSATPAKTKSATMPKDPSDEMSIDELLRQREELDRKLADKKQAEKLAVIAQIVTVARDYQVTIEDLIEAFGGFKPKRKGVKARIKYRDPETGALWSGRGKEPTWLRGKNRDDFLIPEHEQFDD